MNETLRTPGAPAGALKAMATPVSLLPPPPFDQPPARWPAMVLYAATVLLEAEAEPDPGQLAVAWVIRNRVNAHQGLPTEPAALILSAVILAPWQFSCWNEDYAGQRRSRLIGIDPRRWEASWKAACGAWWGFLADPTQGARFYLNPDLTRRIRPGHDLPSWYDPTRVTVRVGKHEFLA
jgi:spore germination cell wall hydrolase CwlJ-like protein